MSISFDLILIGLGVGENKNLFMVFASFIFTDFPILWPMESENIISYLSFVCCLFILVHTLALTYPEVEAQNIKWSIFVCLYLPTYIIPTKQRTKFHWISKNKIQK